jgi:thiamine-phosphate pyrophosphorylase
MINMPVGIYGITSEEFSKGRSNISVVREMIRGGIKIIQYREKGDKTIMAKYEECGEIRRMTESEGVIFIVNDFVDIALAVGADGVHIGQEDMPVNVVRRFAGDMIIGVSTHSPEQALKAVRDGADYIGVGPIYETGTKKTRMRPVGLSYLDFANKNIDLPVVAIGGIKERNIGEVVKRGARTVAMVTEIVGADDIYGKITELNKIISGFLIKHDR